MKKQILNKLKSKKGSALLLAMLFSLMCIILGMVVLSAGETSNGRIINAAEAEQSYYVASSLFREFQNEAKYTHTVGLTTLTEDMQLRAKVSGTINYNNAFGTVDDKHNLKTLKPFIAEALYKTMTEGSYSNDLTFTMGGQGALNEQYKAVVRMTMRDTDYSIYLDVLDVLKVANGSEKSLGAPHLDTIAIQCRRITPKAVGDSGKLADAIFEYDQARLLH